MPFRLILVVAMLATLSASGRADDANTVTPKQIIKPFNGKNLNGFYTWLKSSQRADPENAFSVVDNSIRVSGEGSGYLATVKNYKNYHLSVEYRWGKKTDGSGYVRNSGILLHGTGPDGSARGTWMASLEVQLAQGCEGDFIVIRGQDKSGNTIPVDITSNTITAADKRTRFSPKGKPTKYSGRQFWWSKHQVGFKEKLDTRGNDDLASPLAEWTQVECICNEDRITVKINGETVNECYNVYPTSGRILLQNESNEVFFRNLEIRPLNKTNEDK